MTKFAVALALLTAGPALPCDAPNAPVAIDHIVIAVDDLEVASATYSKLGFELKMGRQHRNGLLNSHIELAGGRELELMALTADPQDAVARSYAEFLAGGEGGAYLALEAAQADVLEAAASLGIEAVPLDVGAFAYVTFSDPGLAAVFFIEYRPPNLDHAGPPEHDNGAENISSVQLEAGPALWVLLERLGAEPCGDGAGRLPGNTIAVRNGRLIVAEPTAARPRVIAAELTGSSESGSRRHPPEECHGLEIVVRSPG